jgi:hypothetical protein
MNFKSFPGGIFLTFAGIVFLATSIFAGTYLLQRNTNVEEKAADSTNLFISPTSQNVNPGRDLTFSVQMSTGGNQITGVDVLLNFDPAALQITSVERGSDLSVFTNTVVKDYDNNAGTISYTGFTLDKSLAISGNSLEVLKVSATANSNATSGSYNITFDSTSAVSAVNETHNTLTGTSPATIVISAPNPTTSPSPAPGEPNYCGGTCGSDYNCKSGLHCYQGYCRNPSCSWSSNCSCNDATNAPTARPTPQRRATATTTYVATPEPTQEQVYYEPEPEVTAPTPESFWDEIAYDFTPIPYDNPTLAPSSFPESKTDNLVPWIVGSLVAACAAVVAIIWWTRKHGSFRKHHTPIIKI